MIYDIALPLITAASLIFGFWQWVKNRQNAVIIKAFLMGLRSSNGISPLTMQSIDDVIEIIETHSFPILLEAIAIK